MNSTNQLPEPNEEPWNEFEQKLRSRSLGPAPESRGDLMYQCGYAAGVSATRKQVHRTTMGWRMVGLAASALACVSISSHFFPTVSEMDKQLGMGEQVNTVTPPHDGSRPKTTPDSWISHLTRERLDEDQATRVLRASERDLLPFEATNFSVESKSSVPGSSSNTLRPSDFPLFL